jgi:PBP1b-binding outer membrane lipoprotein LpoB
MRVGVAILLALLLAGCSGGTPVAPASATESPDVVAKNCADPQWKDKNLGLWYSVCRKPMDW